MYLVYHVVTQLRAVQAASFRVLFDSGTEWCWQSTSLYNPFSPKKDSSGKLLDPLLPSIKSLQYFLVGLDAT